MGKAIAYATPVFFLLIALEIRRGACARPARRLPPQRRDQQPEPRRDEPGRRPVRARAHHRHLRAGVRAHRARHLAATPGGAGCSPSSSTTSAITGITGSATRARCSGPRTWCITRASATTCRRRCARRAAAPSWAGCSTCRWRSPAFRRRCSPSQRSSTCCTSTGSTPRWSASSAGSTAGSPRRRTTACITRSTTRYIDRNYGGIFMAWDRLFGTFVEESERCVYGTRAPLNSWDPLWANFEVYADLARKSWQCQRWGDQASRLAQAAGLAARRSRRRGMAQAGVRPRAGPHVRSADVARRTRVCHGAHHARHARLGAAAVVRRFAVAVPIGRSAPWR